MHVILIGAGRWGSVHAKKWTDLTQRPLLAVIDPRQERAQAISETFGGVVCAQLSDLSCELTDQIVVVATPLSTLSSIALEAIQRGAHVLIEKPGGVTPHQLQELELLRGKHGVKVIVGYVERFNPIITSRLIPQLSTLLCSQTYPHQSRDESISSVRSSTAQGGDLRFDLLCHDLDLFLWMIDTISPSKYKILSRGTLSTPTSGSPAHQAYDQLKEDLITLELNPLIDERSSRSIDEPPSRSSCYHIRCQASRGGRERVWRIGQQEVDLSQHHSDPLFTQCQSFLRWVKEGERDPRLCDLTSAHAVLSLLNDEGLDFKNALL